ncbi:hypothetical protein ScPMuIL_000232 [Solemya velum]
MWIQVRSFDGKKSIQIDQLSKLTKIEDLRERLVEHFDAAPETQRLFYRGKQLEDGHNLFDYSVGLNDLVQLMVRAPPTPSAATTTPVNGQTNDYSSGEESSSSDKENKKPATPVKVKPSASDKETIDIEDEDTVGDLVDGRDITIGAWFEAKIVKVTKNNDEKTNSDCDKMLEQRTENQNIETTTDNEDNSVAMEIDENMNGVKSEKDTSNQNNGERDTKEIQNNSEKDAENKNENDKIIDREKTSDGFLYSVEFEGYEEDNTDLTNMNIRPRANTVLKFKDIEVGQRVMANYNYDDPDERGFWYDCVISKKQDTRTIKDLYATVFIGPELTPLEDCKLLFVHEVFDVEKPGNQINIADVERDPSMSPVKRTNKPECDHCKDNPRRKCKFCACCVCGGKHDPDKQILCDECNQAYHLTCLSPALKSIPEEDEWYCPTCKNDENEIVKAGEKLKESKKKSKMASAQSSSSRDWGRGMACVGRQKVCTVVPSNHFGYVPGAEVGMLWKFRVQASEAGVHRPHVAGIHGREDEGAYSIVLSGGYEDDHDDGEHFTYTGSGGRDLSGNKRTAEQSCDQTLTRMNRALAKNCNAPLDDKKGAEAKDWKAGKPVRVVRNCKGRKHSKYAPEEGNRYDGIYKIVKYWPEKGKSGFRVWRYMLRRDDPTPPPWTSAGKRRIKELGYEMQYPDGYLEAQAQKEAAETPNKGKGKRKRADSDSSPQKSEKKQKKLGYKVDPSVLKIIRSDSANKKLWAEALETTGEGAQKFLQKVEETFTCICCQEIVFKPVTTECLHSICKACIQRSFKAEVYCCPMCRLDLGKDYAMTVNKALSEVLKTFFPGYEAGR